MGFVFISLLGVSCSSITIETKWDKLANEQTPVGRRIAASDLELALDKQLENDPTNLYYLRMRVVARKYSGNKEGGLLDLKAIANVNSDYLEYYWQRSHIGGGSFGSTTAR